MNTGSRQDRSHAAAEKRERAEASLCGRTFARLLQGEAFLWCVLLGHGAGEFFLSLLLLSHTLNEFVGYHKLTKIFVCGTL